MTRPGKYIRPIARGWAAIQVLRPETRVADESGGMRTVKHERLIDSFTGPGSKARAIQAAGTNEVAPSREAVA